MKIIDANTGRTVRIGETFHNVDGAITVLDVDESLFSATALMQIDNRIIQAPLTVRYMHPGFMFQKVAFINS